MPQILTEIFCNSLTNTSISFALICDYLGSSCDEKPVKQKEAKTFDAISPAWAIMKKER